MGSWEEFGGAGWVVYFRGGPLCLNRCSGSKEEHC